MSLPNLKLSGDLDATLREVMEELRRLIEVVDEAPCDTAARGARILNRAAFNLALAAYGQNQAEARFSFEEAEENPVALAASIAAGAASLAAMIVTRRVRLHS